MGSPPRSPTSRQLGRPSSPPRREPLTTVACRLSSPIYISDRAVPNENTTVQLFERWLRVPKTLQQHQPPRLGSSWNDPDFPAGDTSIYSSSSNAQPGLLDVNWQRVTGDLYRRFRQHFTVQQGPLSATCFAGALAAVATREELLLDLVASDEFAADGCFIFQFFKHGAWHRVAVDTCLPVVAATEELSGSSSPGPPGEVLAGLSLAGSQGLWAPLLEKAYAKLHGGYNALTAVAACRPGSASGSSGAAALEQLLQTHPPRQQPATAAAGEEEGWGAGQPTVQGSWSLREVLGDLTGGTVTKMRLDSEVHGAEVAAGGTWHRCTSTLSSGGLVVCSCKAFPGSSQSAGGILPNHAYSIIATLTLPPGPQRPQAVKLLRLQCPWGSQGLWQGPWGQGAEEWGAAGELGVVAAAAAALQQVDGDSTRGAGQWGVDDDPTTFWMSYWDFIQVFNRLWFVDMPPATHHQLNVQCGWVAASAGGPPHLETHVLSQPTRGAAAAVAREAQGLGQALEEAQLGADDDSAQSVAPSGAQTPQPALGRLFSANSNGSSSKRVSSTWCCNPQFWLTVAAAGQVTVTLALQDTKLGASCHTPKRLRTLAAGLTVLQLPPGVAVNPPPRAWAPGQPRAYSSSSAAAGRAQTAGSARIWSASSTASSSAGGWDLLASNKKELPVVATLPLSAAREATITFYASAAGQGCTYLLVPHAGEAGLSAPFMLSVQSASPMQLQQLPSPLSLVIGGAWEGPSAGGSCSCPTWGCNPQYLISCPRQTHVTIALTRPDVVNSLVPLSFDQQECIGLTLVQPQLTMSGLSHRGNVQLLHSRYQKKQQQAAGAGGTCQDGTRQQQLSPSRTSSVKPGGAAGAAQVLYAAQGWTHMDEQQLQVVLPADEPLLLVPSTHGPGLEAPFELRLLSDYPLELVPLPPIMSVAHRARWAQGSAGGSNLHRSWVTNPRFLLQLSRKGPCRLTLQREGGPWRRNQPLSGMIGCYVLRASDAEGSLPAKDWSRALLYESTFVPSELLEDELVLPGGVPLLVVPATYEPGVTGGFVVQISCGAPLEFRQLPVGA